jgi:hypothetical protein
MRPASGANRAIGSARSRLKNPLSRSVASDGQVDSVGCGYGPEALGQAFGDYRVRHGPERAGVG